MMSYHEVSNAGQYKHRTFFYRTMIREVVDMVQSMQQLYDFHSGYISILISVTSQIM